MSRLIVKNLPKSIKEERFRSIFSAKGDITDLRLVHTKDGKFRRFGFVGFKEEKAAAAALNYFNNTFIDTSKIQVEIARDWGDVLPRPWSKYSEGSSAHEKRLKKLEEKKKRVKMSTLIENKNEKENEVASVEARKKHTKKKKKHSKFLGDLKGDEGFMEFVALHSHRGSKQTWTNDELEKCATETKSLTDKQKDKVAFDDSDDCSEEDCEDMKAMKEEKESSSEADECEASRNTALDKQTSDMDYLRTKVTAKLRTEGSHSEDDNDNIKKADDLRSDDESDTNTDSDDSSNSSESRTSEIKENQNKVTEKPSSLVFTVKMRGLPFRAKEKDVQEFFAPLNVIGIRLPLNPKGKPSGNAFVDFECEKDLKEALKRDKDYMKGRYIELFRDLQDETQHEEADRRPWMSKLAADEDDEQESIAESGRLFLRNLAFTCTEEDIEALFGKYGPLSEVHLPLDKNTHKTIGIGFVTFLMPEHAVKAFAELDGHVFQGRLLHILPAKAKKSAEEDETVVGGTSSFKKKKAGKQKSLSSSEHNWNALFLGLNAVADAMADKYNTKKSEILDAESSQSLAVRMALGETQIVAETRKFLVSHGVKLDVFGQPAAKRSKTVIIVKNLPYETSPEELHTLFSPFGQLGRVVLPPSGITALVEFAEPSEARKSFLKLAYSKFKHAPLYLEWAPLDVFASGTQPSNETGPSAAEESKHDPEEEIAEESGKELSDIEADEGVTVFVKNLNFSTTDETLKEKFAQVGPLHSATISRKKDPKKKGNLLSMGYGFVEFKKKKDALQAIKDLQHCKVDDHALELKMSHRKPSAAVGGRKKATSSKQTSSKILVRNVPFEASVKEVRELFSTFGEIKTLRLPTKMSGTGGSHRGFAFVDFLTKQDAKRAFEALSASTHLYGRRLVLEWAKDEDTIETLRKRTADHFHGTQKKKTKKQDILDNLMDTETM